MIRVLREPRTKHRAGEPAHDILAAEAFAVPAPGPLARNDLGLPPDPTGIPEPHDVLAAEEFAMPAPHFGTHGQRQRQGDKTRLARGIGTLAAACLILMWLRRRGR